MSIEELRQMMLNELGPACAAGYAEARLYYMELLTCSAERVVAIANEINFSLV